MEDKEARIAALKVELEAAKAAGNMDEVARLEAEIKKLEEAEAPQA